MSVFKRTFSITLPFFLTLALLLPAHAFAASRSLVLGLSGSDVIALQHALISRGHLAAGYATGYFGPLTLAAVKKFQCDQAIICANATVEGYGIAGPRTQGALGVGGASVPKLFNGNPATVTGALTAGYSGPLEFSGWVPDWRAATATADVTPHLKELTSIMPFGYGVSSSGRLLDTGKFDKEPWTSLIAEAKRQKVRVVPSIFWGNPDTIHRILSNQTTRIALEDEIAALVKEKGFDGIDIDFEAKKHETIDYFSTFLRGLYQRMGNKWVYCTIEARMPLENRYIPGQTIPPDATDYANDYVQMNKYCDRVEIMAYDQGTIDQRLNAARSAPYAPVADPGWVENMVRLAAQTIDRKKLIIGVATYGYEYKVTPIPGNGFQYSRLWAFNPKYATDIAAKLGITPHRTSANEVGFNYDPATLADVSPSGDESTATQQTGTPSTTVAQNQGSQVNTSQPFNYLTWSDAKAIADKVTLARTLGVRGIAVFSLGGAQSPGMWEVLK